MFFLLDQFPIEIFHMIFNYLWTHEILYSFINMSTYINNILSNYDNYKINFESIRKSYFDLVCHYMKPEQVISLILSDKIDTPNQTELFRSRFSMKQFTRLRSLKLIEIDDPEDSLIFDLYQHQNLVSLEIDVKIRAPFMVPIPSLKRLIINIPLDIHSNFDPAFTYVRYEQLRQLTLSHCSCEQLQKIFCRSIQLQSLKISLRFLDPNEIMILTNFHQEQSSPSSLISLSLSIESYADTITRTHIERFLIPLARLRRLELIISHGVGRALLDAYQWEKFLTKQLKQLITFDFKFMFQDLDENIFDQFRHQFWLDKHWYVAYNSDYSFLFTVPHFARTSMEDSSIPIPEYTTLPIEKYFLFYDRITKLICDSNEYELPYLYNHIQEFILHYHSIPNNILDLSKVQTFVINSTKWSYYKVINLIKEKMPSVRSLTLNCKYTSVRYQHSPIISLKQIQMLHLPLFGQYSNDDNLLNWSRFFPSIERLTASIKSKDQISFLIDQFQTMISAYFYINPIEIDLEKPIKITRQWLKKHTNRLRGKNKDNFICQINDQYLFTLYLWIGENDQIDEDVQTIPSSRWWHRCFA